MNYVDYDYYAQTYGGTAITAENAPKAFQVATKTIDALTYCRIVERGLEGLTAFQKGVVQWVACALAEWQTENEDIINNPYSSYSINGVSAAWAPGANIKCINGVMIPTTIYAELVKTGLCYRGVM